jgi:hypothetical protein
VYAVKKKDYCVNLAEVALLVRHPTLLALCRCTKRTDNFHEYAQCPRFKRVFVALVKVHRAFPFPLHNLDRPHPALSSSTVVVPT